MIDAHHHLWQLSTINYPWLMDKGSSRFFGQADPIRQDYLPENYYDDHQRKIARSVHIQVGCITEHNELETALIESFIAQGAPIAAIVAAVDVRANNLSQQLENQCVYKHVKGVRHMIGKSPDENALLPPFIEEEWLEGWQQIAKCGLTFDLQCTAEQYPSIYQALLQVPSLSVVLCHFASPWVQNDVGFKHWLFWMKKFASLPNCYIKLSGFSMFTHQFNLVQYLKYSHAAIAIFGAKRCMLGSNFPVDKLHMTFKQLQCAWRVLLSSLHQDDQVWLTHKAAQSFYQI